MIKLITIAKKKKVSSQKCINDLNHRFVIYMYLVSAKFPQFRGFKTFPPNIREKGIYMEDSIYIHTNVHTYISGTPLDAIACRFNRVIRIYIITNFIIFKYHKLLIKVIILFSIYQNVFSY